jgi:hypothetical protein
MLMTDEMGSEMMDMAEWPNRERVAMIAGATIKMP